MTASSPSGSSNDVRERTYLDNVLMHDYSVELPNDCSTKFLFNTNEFMKGNFES